MFDHNVILGNFLQNNRRHVRLAYGRYGDQFEHVIGGCINEIDLEEQGRVGKFP